MEKNYRLRSQSIDPATIGRVTRTRRGPQRAGSSSPSKKRPFAGKQQEQTFTNKEELTLDKRIPSDVSTSVKTTPSTSRSTPRNLSQKTSGAVIDLTPDKSNLTKKKSITRMQSQKSTEEEMVLTPDKNTLSENQSTPERQSQETFTSEKVLTHVKATPSETQSTPEKQSQETFTSVEVLTPGKTLPSENEVRHERQSQETITSQVVSVPEKSTPTKNQSTIRTRWQKTKEENIVLTPDKTTLSENQSTPERQLQETFTSEKLLTHVKTTPSETQSTCKRKSQETSTTREVLPPDKTIPSKNQCTPEGQSQETPRTEEVLTPDESNLTRNQSTTKTLSQNTKQEEMVLTPDKTTLSENQSTPEKQLQNTSTSVKVLKPNETIPSENQCTPERQSQETFTSEEVLTTDETIPTENQSTPERQLQKTSTNEEFLIPDENVQSKNQSTPERPSEETPRTEKVLTSNETISSENQCTLERQSQETSTSEEVLTTDETIPTENQSTTERQSQETSTSEEVLTTDETILTENQSTPDIDLDLSLELRLQETSRTEKVLISDETIQSENQSTPERQSQETPRTEEVLTPDETIPSENRTTPEIWLQKTCSTEEVLTPDQITPPNNESALVRHLKKSSSKKSVTPRETTPPRKLSTPGKPSRMIQSNDEDTTSVKSFVANEEKKTANSKISPRTQRSLRRNQVPDEISLVCQPVKINQFEDDESFGARCTKQNDVHGLPDIYEETDENVNGNEQREENDEGPLCVHKIIGNMDMGKVKCPEDCESELQSHDVQSSLSIAEALPQARVISSGKEEFQNTTDVYDIVEQRLEAMFEVNDFGVDSPRGTSEKISQYALKSLLNESFDFGINSPTTDTRLCAELSSDNIQTTSLSVLAGVASVESSQPESMKDAKSSESTPQHAGNLHTAREGSHPREVKEANLEELSMSTHDFPGVSHTGKSSENVTEVQLGKELKDEQNLLDTCKGGRKKTERHQRKALDSEISDVEKLLASVLSEESCEEEGSLTVKRSKDVTRSCTKKDSSFQGEMLVRKDGNRKSSNISKDKKSVTESKIGGRSSNKKSLPNKTVLVKGKEFVTLYPVAKNEKASLKVAEPKSSSSKRKIDSDESSLSSEEDVLRNYWSRFRRSSDQTVVSIEEGKVKSNLRSLKRRKVNPVASIDESSLSSEEDVLRNYWSRFRRSSDQTVVSIEEGKVKSNLRSLKRRNVNPVASIEEAKGKPNSKSWQRRKDSDTTFKSIEEDKQESTSSNSEKRKKGPDKTAISVGEDKVNSNSSSSIRRKVDPDKTVNSVGKKHESLRLINEKLTTDKRTNSDGNSSLRETAQKQQRSGNGPAIRQSPFSILKSNPTVSKAILLSLEPKLKVLIRHDSKDLLKGFCWDGCRTLTTFSAQMWKRDDANDVSVPHCKYCIALNQKKPTVIDYWFTANCKLVPMGRVIEVIFSSVYGAKFLGCSKEEYISNSHSRKKVIHRLKKLVKRKTPFDLKFMMVKTNGREHYRAI